MRRAHLANGSVSLQEVWLEEGVKQVACEPFNGVINGQNMNPLAILDICALQGSQSTVSIRF